MNKIYIFWTGDNPIPNIRLKSIEKMQNNSQSEIVLVDNQNLNQFISPDELHPAYTYLKLAHRADYLRCFFMHHFGGGYCDIKQINTSWVPSFNLLCSSSDLLCVGYQEVNRWGVANLYTSTLQMNGSLHSKLINMAKYRFYQLNYKSLMGVCAFILKPNSSLTTAWWDSLNRRLDNLLPELQKNPAKYPKERGGHEYDGSISQYPVPWTYILGDILQPLSFKYRSVISRTLPPPDFKHYQ